MGTARALVWRSLLLVALLVGTLWVWIALGAESVSTSTRAWAGRALYERYFWATYVYSAVAGGTLGWTAVCGTWERRLWNELLASPLGNWEIIWQKLAARALPVVLALIASTPFVVLCYAFGGTSLTELGVAVMRCVVIGAFAGSVGFLVGLGKNPNDSDDVSGVWVAFYPLTAIPRANSVLLVALLILLAAQFAFIPGPELGTLLLIWFPHGFLLSPYTDGDSWTTDVIAISTLVTSTVGILIRTSRTLRQRLATPRNWQVAPQQSHVARATRAERANLLRRLRVSARIPAMALAAGHPAPQPPSWKSAWEQPRRTRVDRWILRRVQDPMLHFASRVTPFVEDLGVLFAWVGGALGGLAAIMLLFGLVSDWRQLEDLRLFPRVLLSVGYFLIALRVVPRLGACSIVARDSGMLESLRVSPMRPRNWLRGVFLETLWHFRFFPIPGVALSLFFTFAGQGSGVLEPMLWGPILIIGFGAWSFVIGSFLRTEAAAVWLPLTLFLLAPLFGLPFAFGLFAWNDSAPLVTGIVRATLVILGCAVAHWRCASIWRSERSPVR